MDEKPHGQQHSPMYEFARRLGELVFSPDYYLGPWWVYFRGCRRRCGNYTGAKAWAAYLQRRFGSWADNGIAVGKVLGESN